MQNRTGHAKRPYLALWLSLILAWGVPCVGLAGSVTVFAAASLKTALDDISTAFAEQTGHGVTVSLAGSSALARQIEAGAPADVFISANVDWMNHLEARGAVDPDTRFDLVGNQLVLITSDPGLGAVVVGPELDLSSLLDDGRLAMALVRAVPAGIYGRLALENLGLWDEVQDQVAQVDNVRAALALVALGEARLGIVYATDAKTDAKVRVIGTVPEESHPPIRYPAAAVIGGDVDLAQAFLDFLTTDTARSLLERQGFAVLTE